MSGSPSLSGLGLNATLDAIGRFWGKVIFTDGCWYWGGALNKSGYGEAWSGRRTAGGSVQLVRAHRFAYELVTGRPIPARALLDHRCHTPECPELVDQCRHRRCVRPDHLVISDSAQNGAPGRTRKRGLPALPKIGTQYR